MARPRNFSVTVGKMERELTLEAGPAEGQWRVRTPDGGERVVDARRLEGGAWSLLIGNRHFRIDATRSPRGETHVHIGGHALKTEVVDPRYKRLSKVAARPGGGATEEVVTAPMPGKVVKVLVKEGEPVKAGQGVIVVEAMKMENELRATRDGTVKKVHVAEAASVEGGQTLVTIGS